MELSPEHQERLKKALKPALVVAVGVTAVKVWRSDDRSKYIHYAEASGSFFAGVVRDGRDKISQVTGQVLGGMGLNGSEPDSELQIVFDDTEIPEDETEELIADFEGLSEEILESGRA